MNLQQQAEMLKLARRLDVPVDALTMLEGVDAASIRQLREQANRSFNANDAPMFKRVVKASKLLPVPALALIAEKILGPLLTAKIAGLMDVERGVGIAGRLDNRYLASVCLHLDPQGAAELIRAIPKKQIIAVAKKLVAQHEHVTMGRYVDVLDEGVILAVIEQLDDADLLRTAFFAENKARLDSLIEKLSEERLSLVIRCAASDAGLWPEALGLMQHLSRGVRGQLGDLAASLEESVLTSMVTAIKADNLWGDALPIVADMNSQSQSRFANLPAIQEAEMLMSVIEHATNEQLWHSVLPLIDLMEESGKDRAAEVAELMDGEQLLALANAATELGLWPTVIDLAQRMAQPVRSETVALMGMTPERVAKALLAAIESLNAWELISEAWPSMSSGGKRRLTTVAGQLGLAEKISD